MLQVGNKFDLRLYLHYVRHGNKHIEIINSIQEKLIEKMLMLSNPKNDENTFNFLDVGSGDGHLAIRTLKTIANSIKFNQIKAILLEPLSEATRILERKLKCVKSPLCDIEVSQNKVEDWLENKSVKRLKQAYDFILCSHVLYYIEDWQNMILSLIRLMKPYGKLCIVLTSRDSELYRLRERILCKLDVEPDVDIRFGEQVVELLEKNNIDFRAEKRESSIFFSNWEIHEFFILPETELDPISEVMSFLFGYPSITIKKKAYKEIEHFINKKDSKEGLLCEYKDIIIWIGGGDKK